MPRHTLTRATIISELDKLLSEFPSNGNDKGIEALDNYKQQISKKNPRTGEYLTKSVQPAQVNQALTLASSHSLNSAFKSGVASLQCLVLQSTARDPLQDEINKRLGQPKTETAISSQAPTAKGGTHLHQLGVALDNLAKLFRKCDISRRFWTAKSWQDGEENAWDDTAIQITGMRQRTFSEADFSLSNPITAVRNNFKKMRAEYLTSEFNHAFEVVCALSTPKSHLITPAQAQFATLWTASLKAPEAPPARTSSQNGDGQNAQTSTQPSPIALPGMAS